MITVKMTNLQLLLIFIPGCFWCLFFSSPQFFSPIVCFWQLLFLLLSLGLHSAWLQEMKGKKRSDSTSPSSLRHFYSFSQGYYYAQIAEETHQRYDNWNT